MKMPKIAGIVCVAVSLTLSGVAKATPVGTVDVAHSGYGASDVIKVWGAGYRALIGQGGVYMLDKTGGTGQGNLWPNGLLGTFCIELHEWASNNILTYDVVMPEEVQNSFLGGPMGADKAEYLRELWGRFFDPDWAGSGPFTSQQNSDAEAFAAAVWEIIHEDLPASPLDWDVTVDGTASRGGFRCQDADTATANDWLHALDGTGLKADLRAFVYDGKQDYISEIPEPATGALLGLGCVVSLLRRKRAAS